MDGGKLAFNAYDALRTHRWAIVMEVAYNIGYLYLIVAPVCLILYYARLDRLTMNYHASATKYVISLLTTMIGGGWYLSGFPRHRVYSLKKLHPNKVFPVKASFDLSVFASRGLTEFMAHKLDLIDSSAKEQSVIVEGVVMENRGMTWLWEQVPELYITNYACPKHSEDRPYLRLRLNRRQTAEEIKIDLSLVFQETHNNLVVVDQEKLNEILVILKKRWTLDRLVPAIEQCTNRSDERESNLS